MNKAKLKELDAKLKSMLAQNIEKQDQPANPTPAFHSTSTRKVAVIRRRRGQQDRRIFLDEESPVVATA
jgi:hypothetical protein